MINERVATLRQRALTARMEGDPEWGRIWEESQKSTEGEPELIREAKATAEYWRKRKLAILEDELIVGANGVLVYGEEKAKPEIGGRQPFKAWEGWPKAVGKAFETGLLSFAGNHSTMDYGVVLAEGLEGLIARVEKRIERLDREEPEAKEKREFLEAMAIRARGFVDMCVRYGDLAEEMAARTEGRRKRELLEIARRCRQVPGRSPRGFAEAVQALWFCFMIVPDAPGRVDQYLGAFYRKDLAAGQITPEGAKELLACLWLRYFMNPGAAAGVGAMHHLTLGGVDREGNDASNEVTWLALEVTEELRVQRPQVGLRCNRNTPRALLERAVRVLGAQCGSPDFTNDEQIVPALAAAGVAVEDARDFSLSGCSEVIVTGKAQMGSVEGFVNLPKILRVVLGLEGEPKTPEELAALTDFEALKSAVEGEMARLTDVMHEASVVRDRGGAARPDLGCSLVVSDCIEKACGYNQGGARYNACNWDVVGIANLADSLAAVRQLVYEEKALSLEELAEALRTDWAGREALRRQALQECPHFGNDDDRVDSLAAWIVERFSALLKRHTPFRGGQYILGTLAGAENMHIEFGRVTGATPDGRHAGEPIADSMGAAQGRDRHGVTALLNSVAKLPHRLLPTASTLNVRLDPALLSTGGGVARVAALIRSHFATGGQQMQFNMVSRQMLEEAQADPEHHGDLMVRVAGYSAPFVSLWPDLQAEVMSRTQHTG